jgi:putative FmdB family regulatory protein
MSRPTLQRAGDSFDRIAEKTQMPLYDMRCTSCEGIFERLMPASTRDEPVDCPYCAQTVQPEMMITGRNVRLNITERWRPNSPAEQLIGAGAAGPGTRPGARRSNVLHVCKGVNCSLCN